MAPPKAEKIDINASYPCPCRREGELVPITLTEAFGCQLCQQIFVLKSDAQVIEQLSVSYPYKRAWYWTGYQWNLLRRGLGAGYWYLMVGLSLFVLLPLVLWLSIAWRMLSHVHVALWVIATLLLAVVPLIVALLAPYRR